MLTEGLHEIHISVNPEQIALLRLYCKDRKMKPIFAVALHGDHPNQLMISKFKNGTNIEVIEKANEIAEDMKKYGLEIFRVKVEAMIHNKGCPTGDEAILEDPKIYWEFHLKLDIANSDELNLLQETVKCHKARISFNIFKRELEPLITLRIYKKSYNDAMSLKADLIENIQSNGFVCNYGIQQEFSVYDTNPDLDKNWLPDINEW